MNEVSTFAAESMNQGKLISVCIPVYNGDKYISESINSIIEQKYSNVEIIVQDNASTDNTWNIIGNLAKQNEKISAVRNKTNVGMMPNWNLALKRASGEFIMLLSADDMLETGFFDKCLKRFQENNIDAVTTNHYYLKKGIRTKRKMCIKEGIYQNFSTEVLLLNPFSINFTMFRKEFIAKLSKRGDLFVRNLWACDYDLWHRVALSGNNIYYINEPLASYRVHDTNLSGNIVRMNRQAMLVILSYKRLFRDSCIYQYRFTLFRFLLRILLNVVKENYFDKKLFNIVKRNLLLKNS